MNATTPHQVVFGIGVASLGLSWIELDWIIDNKYTAAIKVYEKVTTYAPRRIAAEKDLHLN